MCGKIENFSSEFVTKKFSQAHACMDNVISKQKCSLVSGTDDLVKKNNFLQSRTKTEAENQTDIQQTTALCRDSEMFSDSDASVTTQQVRDFDKTFGYQLFLPLSEAKWQLV